MADQSNLSIGGIGGDPSGSHPIGNLDTNWVKTVDDLSIKYTAGTIMADPGASSADATDTYYSEELCVGVIKPGTEFQIGNTGDTQITACWQYYLQSNNNNFNSGNEVVPGTPASLDAGAWTDIGTAAQDYYEAMMPATAADEDLQEAGIVRLRVKMVVTDAGSDGVAAGIVTTAVGVINGSYVLFPFDKQSKKNDTISNPITYGGMGADPS